MLAYRKHYFPIIWDDNATIWLIAWAELGRGGAHISFSTDGGYSAGPNGGSEGS